ncbi:hypothetical protein B4U80_02035 [Leptotrombidium deliense]|uniref:Uncharacterized protein n=1 Tax=Leptotrombidium deliense TaxID=299467 RepID=A0A443RVV7_9ACAR|nr:hypothetical protein B4U80_02035 [Leptotrombidium deliense]
MPVPRLSHEMCHRSQRSSLVTPIS